jgi:hypothetical protein
MVLRPRKLTGMNQIEEKILGISYLLLLSVNALVDNSKKNQPACYDYNSKDKSL